MRALESFTGSPRSVRTHVLFLAALGAAAILVPACSAGKTDGGRQSASADTRGTPDPGDGSPSCRVAAGCIRNDRLQLVAKMAYNDPPNGPIAYTSPPKYRSIRFTGVTGDNVDIKVHAPDGDAEAWLLDSEFGILAFNDDDPAGGTTDSHITATLPSTGSTKYFIGFREKNQQPATFTVTLAGPTPLTYASTRIQQTDIDNGVYNADQLFFFGHVMFGHVFTIDDGLGNALSPPLAGPNPRPNSRRIHNGKFGGPDATQCIACHNVGGADGAGDLAHNLLQDGDGVNLSSVLVRNPPALMGDGFIQQLGIEMTADLQAQLAAAQSGAANGTAQTVTMSSKGVSFGSVTINPDGTTDFSQLQGVDKDLVVKPFGWKGRTALIRRFVEGGFQVHLGMASQALIAQNCKTPIPAVVGDGPDCTDPDNDGVRDEILESQLTSMALYPAELQPAIRLPPATGHCNTDNDCPSQATGSCDQRQSSPGFAGSCIDDPTKLSRIQNGEQLFNQVGCTSCHVQSLTLNSSVHTELPDLSGGPGFVTDLTVDGKLPRLNHQPDGTVNVELWSDLKRHDMGASLADPHDTFGVVPANLFMTRPLWGVGVTAPYLHDGRAATLQDAIAQHDGEAASVRDAFLGLDTDSQAQVVEFLQTLARDPRHTDD
jgi:hypothetical protein